MVLAVPTSPEKYCILGAGSSGLAAAKNLLAWGLPCECLEREDDVGGNWYYGKPASSVYASTHLISSKRLTEYTDFPMPRGLPPYPHHRQVWDYLRAYAQHFGLYEHVRFNTSVKCIEPCGDHWQVTLADGATRAYRGVIIANGHNWDPNWPSVPGTFAGLVLHSSQYKTPEVLQGKRVLVVGGGNSGCDIAVEAAQHAAATFHSLRRGYHYVPKFLLGKPADQCNERLLRWGLPLRVRRAITQLALRVAVGRPESYGLPRPDHALFETHPTINSQLLYYIGHGRIGIKPDIAELCGETVRFTDGAVEPIDVIVYATGYKISFPFLDRALLNWRDDRPALFLNMLHPARDDLAVVGLIQPDSGQFGLVDYQSQLLARFLWSLDRAPASAERLRRLKAAADDDLGAGIHYVRSPRHRLEVEHFSYRRRLQKLIAEFDATVDAPTPLSAP